MRVFYDGFIFRAQKIGGIRRYFENLFTHFSAGIEAHLSLMLPQEAVSPLPAQPTLHCVPRWMSNLSHGGRTLSRLCLRGFELASGCDVVHPTFYETLSGYPAGRRRRRRTPMVLTVHDMLDEIFASQLDPHGVLADTKRVAIEGADAILCVSQSTRCDLQTRYAIPDERIVVTPLAASLREPSSDGSDKGPLPARPYVLIVGNRDFYKNFDRALSAFARAHDTWPELTLGVCGAPFNQAETEWIQALKLADAIHHLGFVSDAHLASLYQNADALLYPSLYEGFGIPPLEAMACGTVVITSNRSSLPEVVGDAALLVDPESTDEIADALLGLRDLSDAHRAALVTAGKNRAAEFSWTKTARVTADVYRALAAAA